MWIPLRLITLRPICHDSKHLQSVITNVSQPYYEKISVNEQQNPLIFFASLILTGRIVTVMQLNIIVDSVGS